MSVPEATSQNSIIGTMSRLHPFIRWSIKRGYMNRDPNLIAKISGHVENSRAFSRYRDIDEEMAKEVILKLE